MRAARAAAALAAVGSLALAAPAMAWDEQECADWYAEHGTVHEDCQSPPPPPEEEQPPVAPSPTPPPAPPAPPAPPVPASPPQSPAAPEAPPTPPEQAPEKQGKPDRGPRASTKGKQEQRSGGAVQAQPAATVTQTESATAGTLPYTGVPAGLLGLGGAGLAAAGAALRRRVS
jgi:outer membrane biosynthesis protein TonB